MDTPDSIKLLREKYENVETEEYRKDLVRLAEGEPLAYVIGWMPFLDTKIWLDSRPVIPRPETEYWLEQAIRTFGPRRSKSGSGSLKVLDLFAGSGAVGVAVLKHAPNAAVDFGELETRHFSTIEKNVRENKTQETRTGVIETDVYSDIQDAYDYIFANPPYLSEGRRARVEESVLRHEPSEALFAEESGFLLIRKTIEGAQEHLRPAGALWIEHEPEQAEPVKRLGETLGFSTETRMDQYGMARFSVLTRMA